MKKKECYLLDVDGTTLCTPQIILENISIEHLTCNPFKNIRCFKEYDYYVDFYSKYVKTYMKKKKYLCNAVKNKDKNPIFLITRFTEKRTKQLESFCSTYNIVDFFELASYKNPTSKLTFAYDVINIIHKKYSFDIINYYDDEISNIMSLCNKQMPCEVRKNIVLYPYIDSDKELFNRFIDNDYILDVKIVPFYTWF